MNTDDFFRRVLPDTGHYCLFKIPQRDHVWFDTIEDLATFAEAHSHQQGWYYGVASYDAAKSRKAEHTVSAKSIWFDIDAGEEKYAKHGDKVYASQEEALSDLQDFTDWLGVSPSLVVSSGAGLHVYYSFKNAVQSMAGWATLAGMLRNAAIDFGLRIDAGVTTDRARVLRPLGSTHSSGNTVELIEDNGIVVYKDLIAAFVSRAVRRPDVPVEQARPSINADLDMPAPVFPKASIDKIASRCQWVSESLAKNGNATEPEWRAMLGLIKHTVEGEDRAHAWSSGSDNYSRKETQKKLDGWKVGPPSCETIRTEHGCKACASCPSWGKVKSPIMLGAIGSGETVKITKPASSGGGNEFGSMIGGDDDDTPRIPKAVPNDEGEIEITVTGLLTPAELLSIAKKNCQRKALIKQGWLSDKFPSTEELFRYNPKNLFFVRAVQNTVVLYSLTQKEVEKDGQKVIAPLFTRLTEQPFFIESYAHGSGNDSEISLCYIYEYNSKSGSPEPVWDYAAVNVNELTDRKAFRKPMGRLGISFNDSSKMEFITDMLYQFINSNLAMLRKRESKMYAPHHMGFQFNRSNKKPMYVQGEYAVSTDGVIAPCTLGTETRNMANRFAMPFLSVESLRRNADRDTYEEVIKPAAQGYCEGVGQMYGSADMSKYGFAWLLGVSSPYLTFVTDEAPDPSATLMPAMGVALSLYSVASGVGKTSLQKVIVAAFAKPEENKANGDRETGMSQISLGVNLSALGSVPFMLDEVTNNDAETTSKLVHKISSGRDKVRATQTGRAVERTGSWTSITTLSTNVSLRMLLSQHREASTAEQNRLVEICFDGAIPGDMSDWKNLYNDLIIKNQGALGLALGRFAVKNWGAMRTAADLEFKRVQEKFGIQNSERYFAKVYTAALLTMFSMKRMGMTPVSPEVMEAEFVEMLTEVRSYLSNAVLDDQDSAEDLVSFAQPRLLLTATEAGRRSKTLSSGNLEREYDLVHNPQIIAQRISGRYVVATKQLYLHSKVVRQWATKGGYDLPKLLRQWAGAGIVVTREGGKGQAAYEFSKQISSGIHEGVMSPLVMRCIQINMKALADTISLDDLPDNVVPITPQSATASAEPNTTQEHNNGTTT